MKLLLAAERLFALHGPAGTSSRAIMAEAGQKNASAINYYSRPATNWSRRSANCGWSRSIATASRVLCSTCPTSRLCRSPARADRDPVRTGPCTDHRGEGKSFFRRFLAQAINSPSSNFYAIVRDRFDTGIRQLVPLIRDEVPHLPRVIADERIAMMIRTSGYMSAHFEAHSEGRPWSTRKDELDFELELMIEGYVGLMRGPHAPNGSMRSSALNATPNRSHWITRWRDARGTAVSENKEKNWEDAMRFSSCFLTTAAALAVLTAHVISTPALAQDNYPSRVVRVIVPDTPGSITDILARVVAEGLSRSLGQQFIIENRPGGGTAIGTRAVVTAPPVWLHAADGHDRAQHQFEP